MIHGAARRGYASAADVYARGRPSYPPATVALARRLAGDGVVVDVGAGTGAFAALLDGLAVVAVDHVEAMLRRAPPALARVQGAAERLPLRDRCAALVTAATAFHWFATDAALRELDRVLAPEGRLLLVWNTRDESVPWVARHTELVDRHAGDAPRYATFEWERVLRSSGRFELEHEQLDDNATPMTREALVDRILSTSFVAALDDEQRAGVEAQANALASMLPARFDYPYVTRSLVLRPTAS